LFFAMCCWCNQTHPVASFHITCIQIVTSFFSFTKNLKKFNTIYSEAAKSSTYSVIYCLSQWPHSYVMCQIFIAQKSFIPTQGLCPFILYLMISQYVKLHSTKCYNVQCIINCTEHGSSLGLVWAAAACV
jgi:hypothetical protein